MAEAAEGMKFWYGAGMDDEPICRFGLTPLFLKCRNPYLESDTGVEPCEAVLHWCVTETGSEEEVRGLVRPVPFG